MNQNPTSNTVWEWQLDWPQDSSQYRTLDTIDGEPMELEWNLFPGFTSLELVCKVQNFTSKMAEPEQFQGRIIFMSMFNDIMWGNKDNEKGMYCWFHTCVSIRKKISTRTLVIPRTGVRNKVVLHWQRKTRRKMGSSRWIDDNKIWRKRTPSFPSHESVVSRYAQKQRRWKIINTLLCRGDTIETVFRTIISVNQLSIHGAVSELCEEYSICQTRTGRLVLAEQSDPSFAPAELLILTPTSSVEILAQENLLLKHKERVENLHQPDQVIKVCTDAGILKTVEVGQYFMTKHTDEFLQFVEPVTCREYTVPRDDKSTDPKGWIRANTKNRPVLEITTSYLQGKHGVEIRIESVNKDNSHSWVRISHGLNKLVTDLIDKDCDDDEQETSTTKKEVFAIASRSKAKAKPRRPSTTCSSSRILPILERTLDWY